MARLSRVSVPTVIADSMRPLAMANVQDAAQAGDPIIIHNTMILFRNLINYVEHTQPRPYDFASCSSVEVTKSKNLCIGCAENLKI